MLILYETKAKSSLIGRLARPWLPGSNRTQTHGLHCETLRRLYLCAHFRPEVDSMPRYCSVYGCFNNSEKNRDVSYHDFPSNNEQAKAWKIRIRKTQMRTRKTQMRTYILQIRLTMFNECGTVFACRVIFLTLRSLWICPEHKAVQYKVINTGDT